MKEPDRKQRIHATTEPWRCTRCGRSRGMATTTEVVLASPPATKSILVCRACGERVKTD